MAGADEELPCNFSNLSLVGDDLQAIRSAQSKTLLLSENDRPSIDATIDQSGRGSNGWTTAGQGETLHL